MQKFIYETPRHINSLNERYFYHAMDLPGYGRVKGEWDLRGKESTHLGLSFEGKSVLEIRIASGCGYLGLYMEELKMQLAKKDRMIQVLKVQVADKEQ